MGNLTPPSRIAIKGKKAVPHPLWRAISLSLQYAISTSSGISNFCLNMAKDAAVSRRKAKPILKSNTEGRNLKKEAEVKGEGKRLTLGFRDERVSGLVSKLTNECSAESKLRKWGVKK